LNNAVEPDDNQLLIGQWERRMATILLQRQGKNQRGQYTLCLELMQAFLIDPLGRTVAVFAHEIAENRIVIPNDWSEGALTPLYHLFGGSPPSSKGLGIRGDDQIEYYFVLTKNVRRQVQSYLDTALAIQGPEQVRGLRWRGWKRVVCGLLLTGFSTGLLIVTILAAADGANGHAVLMFAISSAVLFQLGLGQIVAGSRNIRRARNARLLRAELEAEETSKKNEQDNLDGMI
jgi:hypothetical protein